MMLANGKSLLHGCCDWKLPSNCTIHQSGAVPPLPARLKSHCHCTRGWNSHRSPSSFKWIEQESSHLPPEGMSRLHYKKSVGWKTGMGFLIMQREMCLCKPNLPVDLIAESTRKRTQGTNQSKYMGYSPENWLVSPKSQFWGVWGVEILILLCFSYNSRQQNIWTLIGPLFYKKGKWNWKGMNVILDNLQNCELSQTWKCSGECSLF